MFDSASTASRNCETPLSKRTRNGEAGPWTAASVSIVLGVRSWLPGALTLVCRCKYRDDQEERRTKAAMYLGRAAAAVEENNQKQMINGAEREAERRQRVARCSFLFGLPSGYHTFVVRAEHGDGTHT